MASQSAASPSRLPSSSDDRTLPASRANNLNAMRLALASLVMFSHSFALSYGTADNEPLKWLTKGQVTCGTVAVDLFFLISGMLITASWFRSKSMNDFLLRRVLRIYPGYVVALTLSALTALIACPESRPHFGALKTWIHYFLSDAVTLDQMSLAWPGTFAQNPWPGFANGSLWTIQQEFICYVFVLVLGLFCLFKRRMSILFFAVAVFALYTWQLLHTRAAWGHLQVNASDGLVPRFYSYFLVGMLIWLFRDKVKFSWVFASICLVALLLAARFAPIFSLLFLPAGSYLALNVGLTKPWRFTRWTQKTDISYGVYLYAWPVQQVIAMHPALRSAFLNLVIAVPVTVILALLSWHLVENRFLAMKSVRFVDYDPALQQEQRAQQ